MTSRKEQKDPGTGREGQPGTLFPPYFAIRPWLVDKGAEGNGVKLQKSSRCLLRAKKHRSSRSPPLYRTVRQSIAHALSSGSQPQHDVRGLIFMIIKNWDLHIQYVGLKKFKIDIPMIAC